MALKMKKGKTIIQMGSSSDNNDDNAETSLLIKGFKTFFTSKEG